ncbi:MAG: DUF1549 domain-containing protein, partial [Planctomycetaceae bacterium]|nr:DUF1549 domain-containing protein [Planctomycetaceae bacterium]
MQRNLLTHVIAVITGSLFGFLSTGSMLVADDGLELFESRIRPVLVEHCYACHSAEAATVKGGLLLDTREGIRLGGDSGPAVVPHQSEESLLLDALRYDAFQMPPKQQLSKQVVEDFERWIELGAPDPREGEVIRPAARVIDIEAGRLHWSFQPPQRHQPPVDESGWSHSDIDRFVIARLVQHGMTPAPPADRRTLLRRWSYDLTGLPPSAEQLEAFLNDDSETAAERAVDQLLSSPQFGEHWARHWL